MKSSPQTAVKLTLDDALSIARNLKYGPLPDTHDPVPTREEAIEIIKEERKACGFNWITGEHAVAVLEGREPAI